MVLGQNSYSLGLSLICYDNWLRFSQILQYTNLSCHRHGQDYFQGILKLI